MLTGAFLFIPQGSNAQGNNQPMFQYVQVSVVNYTQDNLQLGLAAFFMDKGAFYALHNETVEFEDTLNIHLYYEISTGFISKGSGFIRDTLDLPKADSTSCLHVRAFSVRHSSSAPGGLDTILRTDTVFCLSPLAIPDVSNGEQRFQIFPNPVKGVLSIQTFGGNRITNLALTDITGRVLKRETGKNVKKMNMEAINPGIYFLEIETDNGQVANYKIRKE